MARCRPVILSRAQRRLLAGQVLEFRAVTLPVVEESKVHKPIRADAAPACEAFGAKLNRPPPATHSRIRPSQFRR